MARKSLVMPVITFILMASSAVHGQEYPDYQWSHIDNPASAGWDTAKLSQLKTYILDSTYITGLMLVQKGKVVFDYGDLEENSYIASCRKSVLALLYGTYIRSGIIRLDKTLADLGLDDVGGLLPSERLATVRDIISARSGVFHPASYLGDYLDLAPRRGSVKHGDYWLYSNWDFNVAGYIFEKETQKDIYNEVSRVLAIPLHMQDWDRSLQHKAGDISRSNYLAYPMWFSTRDMARIGQLMLNGGKWGGNQLIDPSWITEMLRASTNYTEINDRIPDFRATPYRFGYGYMWWLWQMPDDPLLKGGYSAFGNMGQTISVFPAANLVVVYKTKENYERETPFLHRYRVIDLAVHAFRKAAY